MDQPDRPSEPSVIPEGLEMPTRSEYLAELAEDHRYLAMREGAGEGGPAEVLALAQLNATLAVYHLMKEKLG